MGRIRIELMKHQKLKNLQKGKTKKNNHKTIKIKKITTALVIIGYTLISKRKGIQVKQG